MLPTGLLFDGDAGFALEDVDVSANVEFGDPDFIESEADAAATIGNAVDAQVGVAFPRVTFNVLNQEVAYVLTGITAGSRLTWGPICKSGYARPLVQGGPAHPAAIPRRALIRPPRAPFVLGAREMGVKIYALRT